MYPRLFELGPVTVYTYGVLLAAAYLLGLKLAMVRAKARGLDANRVLAGSVVDFVDVYWRAHHFWAFNVADSAISVGVAIMILDMLGVGSRSASA